MRRRCAPFFPSSSPSPPLTRSPSSTAGFSITPAELDTRIRAYVADKADEVNKLGWAGFSKVSGLMRQADPLRWVAPLDLKGAAEAVYADLFGSRDEHKLKAQQAADKAKKDNKAAVNAGPKASTSAVPLAAAESPDDMFAQGWLSRLHKPGGNEQKIPERMHEHLAWTKGKVFTRFPPEPNGFLHVRPLSLSPECLHVLVALTLALVLVQIGHSKAIAVNFGFAKYHKGHCYLRYDDTNPEAEEQIYFDKILENVRWLGYEPYQVTHSSDHFAELYDLAVLLIKKGFAYTSNDTGPSSPLSLSLSAPSSVRPSSPSLTPCALSFLLPAEEISAQRGGKDHGPRHDSKDRSKPVEQSLHEFADMRAGKYKPGEMVLRMKQDMSSSNPTMWDIIAYRVLGKPHHRTGTEWCIYPTYDFTHCLCDSFENISCVLLPLPLSSATH